MTKKQSTPPPEGLEPGALSGPLSAALQRSLNPWSAKAFAVFFIVFFVLWVCWNIFSKVHYLVWWGVIAAFLYFAMAPAVNWLVDKGLKRGLATALVMLLLLLSIVGLVAAMSPLLVSEAEALYNDVPKLLQSISDVGSRFGITVDTSSNSQTVQNAVGSLKGHIPDVAGSALSVTSRLIGGFFEFFVILLFTFFLLANETKFRHFVLSFFKPNTQKLVGQGWDIAVYKTGGYLYSRILTSILAGSVVGTALFILDCPYALALAIWYGIVSQFLPMIGTYVAAALPLVILLVQDPLHALFFVIVLAAWIPFQDYIISPKVSAKTMSLSPATALIALLAGGALFGALGAFLALPAAAVIQSIMTAFFPRHDVVEGSTYVNPKDDKKAQAAPSQG